MEGIQAIRQPPSAEYRAWSEWREQALVERWLWFLFTLGLLMTFTLAIFLPGFLLVLGLMEGWQWLSSRPALAGAVAGINAAVVGLLLAALYQPVFVSAVHDFWDLLIVVAGFVVLRSKKVPLWGMVLGMAGLGVGVGLA